MPQSVQFQLGGTLKFIVEDEGYATITVRYEQFTITAKGDSMSYNLPVDRQVTVKVAYVDASGNPAVVDGEVTWATSNEDVATVTVDAADSTQATVRPSVNLGTTQITATADADLGAGVRELITMMDVTTIAGEAVAGTISPVGDPVPIT